MFQTQVCFSTYSCHHLRRMPIVIAQHYPDSVERLQWAFSSNDGNYRWKSRLEFGTSPLEGGQFTVQQTWFGQSAVDEFWDRIEEYGIHGFHILQSYPKIHPQLIDQTMFAEQ